MTEATTTPETKLPRVLYVDDEENVLLAMKRHQRKQFDIHTCSSPLEALEHIRKGNSFSVIVSDLRMPGMDGVEFLRNARGLLPDATRIMVTGNADLDAAKRAVNDGHVFRFLSKPCEPDVMREAIASGHRIYELTVAERDLLERTLRGAIDVLTQTLSLSNPEAFGRASRISRYVSALVKQLELDDPWKYEVAAMLSQLGMVAVPPDVTRKAYRGDTLTAVETNMLAQGPEAGSRLLRTIPRLEEVAEMVRLQNEDHAKIPAGVLGPRVLRVALDFDMLLVRGKSDAEALKQLTHAQDGTYDPTVLEVADKMVLAAGRREECSLKVVDLRCGMIVAQPITTEDGLLVVAAGQEVTESLLQRLHNWARSPIYRVREPVRVLVAARET